MAHITHKSSLLSKFHLSPAQDLSYRHSFANPNESNLMHSNQLNLLEKALKDNTPLGFILLEIDKLSDISENIREDQLNALNSVIYEYATYYFNEHFKESKLLFVKQLGFVDYLMCFIISSELN